MSTLDSLIPFIVFAAVWLVVIGGVVYWVAVVEIPRLSRALKESGMPDKEISKKMTSVAFPPRFFK